MNLTDLQQRIAAGENLHTELKLWPINPNSLAETLTAFANTDGGQLLIGVSDSGQIHDETLIQRATFADFAIQSIEQFFLGL